ncbi:hypothetical protein CVT26_013214 [Gymnopilus dilepis]|uniref:Uncharacterized protein n=1 Tax=Gymnopilus dilepis TaxID=231916 RepID=A0A409WV61_9AGAR|nr:hypothetical protein CVT26_013214 [Gymnopilus dilepis]
MPESSDRQSHHLRPHDPDYTTEIQQYITFLRAREDASKIDIASINLFNQTKGLAQNGFSKPPPPNPTSNAMDASAFSHATSSFNDPFSDLLHSHQSQQNLSESPTPARPARQQHPLHHAVNPFLDARYFDHYRPHCFKPHSDNNDQLINTTSAIPTNPANMSQIKPLATEETLLSVNLLEGVGDMTQNSYTNTMPADTYGTESFSRQNHF